MSLLSKRWCFTENNPVGVLTDETFKYLKHCRFAIWQLEEGESGTMHYQGYMEFSQGMRLTSLKNVFGDWFHFEKAKGNQAQNIAYCTKAEGRHEGPFEYGDREVGGQGRRNDTLAKSKLMCQRIREGATDYELAMDPELDTLFLRYPKNVAAYRLAVMSHTLRTTKTEVFWLYGPTGTGKTTYALQFNPYLKPHSTRWFDGYQGQSIALLDEFDDTFFSLNFLLQLIDKSPIIVESKGAHVPWIPKTIYITSNDLPLDLYKKAFERNPWKREALCRRIEHIWHFTEKYDATKDIAPPRKESGLDYYTDWNAKQNGISENFVLPKTLGYVTDDE